MQFKNVYGKKLFSYSSNPWLCQKSICICQDSRTLQIKCLYLRLKRSGTEYVTQKINFFNVNSCKLPSTSSLKSFAWFWRVVAELLPIFSSHQHVQHMTSQILLILNGFYNYFGYILIRNYSSLNPYNSGTRRDIRDLKQTRTGSQKTAFILGSNKKSTIRC